MIYQFFATFGQIDNPLQTINPNGYGGIDTGPAEFMSNLFRFIAIAAGIFALFNIIMAGTEYITSGGDPKGVEAARRKITMSILGLAIISISFTLAAILGQILFGDWLAILLPTVIGPGTL